jgi:hypothetical protein
MEKRWMKLKEAAAYSAIGKQRLVKLAEARDVRGFKDSDTGYWIFDKLSLDNYRESQFEEDYKDFAVDLLRKAGIKCKT